MRKISFFLLGIALLAVVAVERAQATGFATFYAIVGSNGATARGSGVTSSSRTGVGAYEVVFGRSVTGCATVVSIGGTSSGFATTQRKAGNAATILVFTRAANGVLANRGFNLLVSCAP